MPRCCFPGRKGAPALQCPPWHQAPFWSPGKGLGPAASLQVPAAAVPGLPSFARLCPGGLAGLDSFLCPSGPCEGGVTFISQRVGVESVEMAPRLLEPQREGLGGGCPCHHRGSLSESRLPTGPRVQTGSLGKRKWEICGFRPRPQPGKSWQALQAETGRKQLSWGAQGAWPALACPAASGNTAGLPEPPWLATTCCVFRGELAELGLQPAPEGRSWVAESAVARLDCLSSQVPGPEVPCPRSHSEPEPASLLCSSFGIARSHAGFGFETPPPPQVCLSFLGCEVGEQSLPARDSRYLLGCVRIHGGGRSPVPRAEPAGREASQVVPLFLGLGGLAAGHWG